MTKRVKRFMGGLGLLLVVVFFCLTKPLLGGRFGNSSIVARLRRCSMSQIKFEVLLNLKGSSGSFLYGVRETKRDFSLDVRP